LLVGKGRELSVSTPRHWAEVRRHSSLEQVQMFRGETMIDDKEFLEENSMSQVADTKQKTKLKVLSLGAGVNSTALLVLKAQGKVDFDLAIFADTGGEQPETYDYLEKTIKPFCEKHKIKLAIAKREGPDLFNQYWNDKLIPFRMYRSCTDKFKIRVIKKFLLQNYPNENIVSLIGYCKGEEKRAEHNCGFEAPLIELGIDREGCKTIIVEAGLPLPMKSGCFFCPHQPMKSWLNLLKNHPDLYTKAEILEKNTKRYPRLFLPYDCTLEALRKGIQDQKSMCTFLSSCSFCEIEDNEVGV